ncbi:MAG: ATP-binding protein [Candidatus Omnitrophota bacterium]
MKTAPIPENEKERLLSLQMLNILDTPIEDRFDCITKISQNVFNVPISTLTLVDKDREWYKSAVGLSCTQGPRDISFCGHAVLESDILYIEDTAKDVRFADNPMVTGDPPIRFYAGQSLTGPGGFKIGVLCIKDTKPREFSKDQINKLKDLARWAEIELNSRELTQALIERKEKQELLEKKMSELKQSHEELKRTQDHLLQAEKMASIGQLAAGVAHEINNPIGFVGGNLQVLKEYFETYSRLVELSVKVQQSTAGNQVEDINKYTKQLREKMNDVDIDFLIEDTKNLLNESNQGIERVGKIVRGLRSFSHISEEKKLLVQVNDIVQNSLDLTFNELKYKADIEKDLKAVSKVECYPQQISQVLINLLVNAAQAITQHGIVKVTSFEDDQYVCITVSDSGQGMDEETRKRIFDPFFTTKPVGMGTGLGLSISYEIIVDHHQGRLEVESQIGKGSTFKISLPRK